jgi:hypothetical protein
VPAPTTTASLTARSVVKESRSAGDCNGRLLPAAAIAPSVLRTKPARSPVGGAQSSSRPASSSGRASGSSRRSAIAGPG